VNVVGREEKVCGVLFCRQTGLQLLPLLVEEVDGAFADLGYIGEVRAM